MIKKLGIAALAAATIVLAACGGGGGSDSPSSTSSGSSTSTTPQSVAGPLDTVQSTLSSTVLAPLESATANTALSGVLTCANSLVVSNVLDIADAVLNGLQNPASLASTTPAQVQTQLNQLAQNLKGLLTALASQGSCQTATTGTGNPLAGTPLAALGDQLLPVLQQILSQTSSGNTNGFASLAALVQQLDTALHTAIAQLPASATTAPIVGGTLTTLDAALSDTASLLTAVANNDSSGLKTAVQNLLDHLLVNVTTGIVPLTLIEAQAGKPGAISNTVKQAAATLSAAVATALSAGTTQLLAALNSSQLAPVVNPVVNGVLPALIAPLTKLLDSLGSASGTTTGGPTGTALDALLTPITTLLGSILGGSSGTCIFASLPIVSALCTS
jgi:hypothetical protein